MVTFAQGGLWNFGVVLAIGGALFLFIEVIWGEDIDDWIKRNF